MSEQNPEMPSDVTLSAPRKSKPWRSILLGIIIFLCGLIVGAGVAVVAVQKMVVHAITNPEEIPQRITQRLRSKLDLTNEQATQIKSIIAMRQKAIQQIRREFQPRLEKELDLAREDVAAVLGPEKAQVWRKRFERLKRMWLPPPANHAEPPSE
jgi:hypothetical protein